MTTAVLKAMTMSTALAAAIALGALLAPPAARAGEFCSLDVDHVLGCGFSSMEQCKASVSGVNGECSPKPFAKEGTVATIDRNAYAYAPGPLHHKQTGRAAKASK